MWSIHPKLKCFLYFGFRFGINFLTKCARLLLRCTLVCRVFWPALAKGTGVEWLSISRAWRRMIALFSWVSICNTFSSFQSSCGRLIRSEDCLHGGFGGNNLRTSNHYSTRKPLSRLNFLCGKSWVSFPINLKMTLELPHKNLITTIGFYGIINRKMII